MIEISDADIHSVQSLLNVEFDERRIFSIKNFTDVQACPGSGKTTMVAAKLLIMAKKWKHSYRGICVLTHTNVAKREIIEQLNKSNDGDKLLSYPHFIGTIQEFVNKFLAIPYLRSNGFNINAIDDDTCLEKGWRYLNATTRSYLERKRITSLSGLEFKFSQGELTLSVPGFTQKSTSNSYNDLTSAKDRLMSEGCFFYREMYAFAKSYLVCNSLIEKSIRSRFPIVLVDEMQDTQKFQDELLNDIFKCEEVKLQRFGDPDQAIYSGDDEENDTYNKVNLEKIDNSHRFDQSIALLAKRLSYNRLELSSNIEAPPQSSHTIFLVDEHSRNSVLQKFAELCAIRVPRECSKPIKTVGAVGLRKDDGLSICNYVDSYDKGYSKDIFKSSKLICYFYESKKFIHIHESYRLILDGVAKCGLVSQSKLKIKDESECRYTPTSIRRYLKATNQQVRFNILINRLLKNDFDNDAWAVFTNELKAIFKLNVTDELDVFFSFENPVVYIEDTTSPNVIHFNIGGRIIKNEVATIHSVKGETHAATLVLETKHHQFDIEQLIDYILGETTRSPTGARKIKFMKQLYVAFSRPKHLLCIAMDKGRFPAEHAGKLEYAGWRIVDLTIVNA
ncbi:UvrD-helicase domain-containing protein [Aeromonas veronii]|uniref:UvrD-helicase domain-containing protein n=1 Tax=Aeromonas veronii TaxID=654 RepID=UPI0022561BDB|nr:UvrD-helicase domain-containing protein [Aeromonas veronii]MCX4045661.1 UvrD-helicase domain-containing protein [Aeromonas veronii]